MSSISGSTGGFDYERDTIFGDNNILPWLDVAKRREINTDCCLMGDLSGMLHRNSIMEVNDSTSRSL